MLDEIKEFLSFMSRKKKWWILPIVLALLVLGALFLISAQLGAAGPFLYTIF